jgi:hypothetical protein|nr:MAG TPA: hypothetical protein [Caudoviricetes sp.]
MNICSAEYFQRLDPFSEYPNVETELQDKLDNKAINKQDLIDFLSEGYINVKQFIEAVRYADVLEEKED